MTKFKYIQIEEEYLVQLPIRFYTISEQIISDTSVIKYRSESNRKYQTTQMVSTKNYRLISKIDSGNE